MTADPSHALSQQRPGLNDVHSSPDEVAKRLQTADIARHGVSGRAALLPPETVPWVRIPPPPPKLPVSGQYSVPFNSYPQITLTDIRPTRGTALPVARAAMLEGKHLGSNRLQ
jgi:hypothetical protein